MENQQQYQEPSSSTNTTSNPGASDSTTGGNRRSQSSQEVIDELNRLGLKFAEVVHAAWESDERKRLEKEVRAGVVSLMNGLERGLRRAGESDQAKDILHKAENMADTMGERIRSSQTSHEMAGGLAKGLHILAQQIDKLAEELQRKAASSSTQSTPTPPVSPTDAQDIPITKV